MPSWRHSTPMSPGEKLDPLPDPFILQPPVFHPVLPYVTTIFGGLRAGKMVMLQGAVPLEARRFQVDFQCGCSLHPRPDIAIHFNPRFHTTKPHVICNTLHLERWQAEARWPHLPLQRGAYFLILFLFGNEEMKVSVNGQHFLHYCYRLPLSRVDTLAIFGDILVEAVGFLNINPFAEGSSEYPVGYPFLLKSPSLEVPCSRALPRGLWPGQVIVLRGLVLPEPKEPVNSGAGMQYSPAQHGPQTRHNGVGVLLVPFINSVVLGKSRHLSEAGVLSFPIRIKGERSSQS
ncbi:galectin-12 isoform X8 [Halichoerus grypus]|uniref:galectin-12 isoform X10 n=1 Tax=Halichoerus grypus TaxID=9711 RepID=UPI0016591AA6|nr:galectin-12 isoform X10 [Halichoerus grypus]